MQMHEYFNLVTFIQELQFNLQTEMKYITIKLSMPLSRPYTVKVHYNIKEEAGVKNLMSRISSTVNYTM
jgi:hypothetical protein